MLTLLGKRGVREKVVHFGGFCLVTMERSRWQEMPGVERELELSKG